MATRDVINTTLASNNQAKITAAMLRGLIDELVPYNTITDVQNARIDVGISAINVLGNATLGDGGGGVYMISPTQAPGSGIIQSADGQYWKQISTTSSGGTGSVVPQGPQGATGATGPSGPAGPTGPQGPQGATGPAGSGGTGSGTSSPNGVFETLKVSGYNQNLYNDPNDAMAARVDAYYWGEQAVTPGFPGVQGLAATLTEYSGFNNYGTDFGGTVSTNKLTSIPFSVGGNFLGSGQHFLFTANGTFCGMSDSFMFSGGMTYATGPIAGDEGQGFSPQFYCFQQNYLPVGNIVRVQRSTYSSTTTAAIRGSKDFQTIHVASTTNAQVGDWVVINQAPPTGYNLIWAGMITAVDAPANTITLRCTGNVSVGAKITPAMVLILDNTYMFGQDRLLVNVFHGDGSEVKYTTGTASQNGSGGLDGHGTNWTVGMVGGNADNIGAISFDADTYWCTDLGLYSSNYSYPLQGNSSLQSWFQIAAIGGPTYLGILSNSAAGAADYRGKAPWTSSGSFSTGTYVIKPALEYSMCLLRSLVLLE
jgi:hypothetical protein